MKQAIPDKLRRHFLIINALTTSLFVSAIVVLNRIWQPGLLLFRCSLALIALFLLFAYLYTFLHENYTDDSGHVKPSLGIPNIITILRGALAAFLLFFTGIPQPQDLLGWLPAALFTIIVVTDLLDGILARRLGSATHLGKRLDIRLDSAAALVAILLVVQYEKAPAWFLIIGAMPFLFHFSLWMKKRKGRKSNPLPFSKFRRALGTLLFIYLIAKLTPILIPELFTYIIAVLIVISFVRDWRTINR